MANIYILYYVIFTRVTLTKVFPSVLRLRVCSPPRCATKEMKGVHIAAVIAGRFTRKERTFWRRKQGVVEIIQNKLGGRRSPPCGRARLSARGCP